GASASIYSANLGATLNLTGNLDLGVGQTLTTDGKGNIDVTGVISGTTGSGISKLGDGTLIVEGANTFDGTVNVNQGVVRVKNAAGLGSNAGATFVNTGAAVQFQGNFGATNVGENFVIRDVGVGFDQTTLGSIRAIDIDANTGSSVTLSGTITLGNNASIGVDSKSTLTIGVANA